jgi:hypothetical protein
MAALLATLYPETPAAQHALYHRRNKRHLKLSPARSNPSLVLNLSAILGRRCISFGASRLNDVQLTANGLSPREFVILLDYSSRKLCIKDMSSTGGTQIVTSSTDAPLRLTPGVPVPLSLTSTIVLGGQVRFRINSEDLKSAAYNSTFTMYTASLGLAPYDQDKPSTVGALARLNTKTAPMPQLSPLLSPIYPLHNSHPTDSRLVGTAEDWAEQVIGKRKTRAEIEMRDHTLKRCKLLSLDVGATKVSPATLL